MPPRSNTTTYKVNERQKSVFVRKEANEQGCLGKPRNFLNGSGCPFTSPSKEEMYAKKRYMCKRRQIEGPSHVWIGVRRGRLGARALPRSVGRTPGSPVLGIPIASGGRRLRPAALPIPPGTARPRPRRPATVLACPRAARRAACLCLPVHRTAAASALGLALVAAPAAAATRFGSAAVLGLGSASSLGLGSAAFLGLAPGLGPAVPP